MAGHPASSRLPAWMFALGLTFVAYYGLLLFSDLTRPQPLGLRLDVGPAGAIVRAVAPDSLAAQAGLAAGDRVLGANGYPIRSLPPAQFTREASASYQLPPYSLTVLRGKIED